MGQNLLFRSRLSILGQPPSPIGEWQSEPSTRSSLQTTVQMTRLFYWDLSQHRRFPLSKRVAHAFILGIQVGQ